MKRREFTSLIPAGALALGIPGLARAEVAPEEGRHYIRLAQPMPVAAPDSQYEVIEFFWYGCPHCNAFEPALEGWVRQLHADVAFRRVPVAFSASPYVAHQRIYYALETMGLVDSMQRKVFYAIHGERMRLERPAEIADFMSHNGVDSVKFMQIFDSFAMQAKLSQANRLVDGYKIDAVPAMGIAGRFYTSGALAGDNLRMLVVTDYLLQRLRNKLK